MRSAFSIITEENKPGWGIFSGNVPFLHRLLIIRLSVFLSGSDCCEREQRYRHPQAGSDRRSRQRSAEHWCWLSEAGRAVTNSSISMTQGAEHFRTQDLCNVMETQTVLIYQAFIIWCSKGLWCDKHSAVLLKRFVWASATLTNARRC